MGISNKFFLSLFIILFSHAVGAVPKLVTRKNLYHYWGTRVDQTAMRLDKTAMNFTGWTVTVEEAQRQLEAAAQQYPLIFNAAREATLLHGSSSQSLLSFTQYGVRKGRLYPTGELFKMGKTPFGGANDMGIAGVNQEHISTVFATEVRTAMDYASARPWTPAISRQLSNLYSGEKFVRAGSGAWTQTSILDRLEDMRFAAWRNLDDLEKSLVSDPFPVMYALNPKLERLVIPSRSDVRKEMLVRGGLGPSEIDAIFVPVEHRLLVRGILSDSGHSVRVAVAPF